MYTWNTFPIFTWCTLLYDFSHNMLFRCSVFPVSILIIVNHYWFGNTSRINYSECILRFRLKTECSRVAICVRIFSTWILIKNTPTDNCIGEAKTPSEFINRGSGSFWDPKKKFYMMEPIGVCQDFPDFWQIFASDIRWSGDKVRDRIAIKIHFWGLRPGRMSQKNLFWKNIFFDHRKNSSKILENTCENPSQNRMYRVWQISFINHQFWKK